jgi:hypothetical protein
MKRLSSSLLAASALAMMAGAGAAASVVDTQPRRTSGWHMNPPDGHVWRYLRGPGWTQAKVKRMARKRRNVLRNRRAHR